MKQIKPSIRNRHAWQGFYEIFFSNIFPFIKIPRGPINSIEHFVDIDSLIRNNNETGVGVHSEKNTCRQRNNGVKNSSSHHKGVCFVSSSL